MLICWINAPYVVFGVLASFILLLSTVVSEQRDVNSTEDPSLSTTQAELETIRLMHLPFASNLMNPCTWGSYNRPPQIASGRQRARFIREFFTFVTHYAKVYKEDAQEILQNHTISGCADLHVGNLPSTPTLLQLKGMNMERAMNEIYSSLLVHSAYNYFIHYQVYATGIRCSNSIEGEQNLANESHSMALKQKALACYVGVGLAVLGYDQDDVGPLLNENISDLAQCSRRALRDCQVLKSTINFLEILQKYSEDFLNAVSSTTLLNRIVTASIPTSSSVPTTQQTSTPRTTD